MRKLTLIVIAVNLFFLTIFSTLDFAQQSVSPGPETSPSITKVMSLIGKVTAVSLADAVKGTRSEIVVTGKNGQKYIFLVKSTTTIYDANWKPINLDKIVKDKTVIVKYTATKEGVLEAKSIKIKA